VQLVREARIQDQAPITVLPKDDPNYGWYPCSYLSISHSRPKYTNEFGCGVMLES